MSDKDAANTPAEDQLVAELAVVLAAIVDRSHNGELGTSKVIDMRKLAEAGLAKIEAARG